MKRIHAAFAGLCLLAFAIPFVFAAGAGDAPAVSAAEKAYQQKAAKLTDKDVKGWMNLADYCEAQLLLDHREEALRKVLSINENNADAHRRLDEVKVGTEWLACAEADAAAAKEHEAKGEVYYGRKWVSAKVAEAPRAADRKQFGWEIQSRIDGKYCVVYSAGSFPETRAVAAVLDNVVSGYTALYGKHRRLKPFKPFDVHLFASAEALPANYKRMTGFPGELPKTFGGVYDPNVKSFFISTQVDARDWNLDQLLRVVAHETTHAVDHLACDIQCNPANHMPTWIAEGRAIYSEYSLAGRQFLPGAIRLGGGDGRAQLLGKIYKTGSLETLVGLEYAPFMKNVHENYVMAWSFTHFLMNGQNGKHREAFLKFVAGCPQNSSAKDFERIVGKPADMTKAWQTNCEEYLVPTAEASVAADRKARGLSPVP